MGRLIAAAVERARPLHAARPELRARAAAVGATAGLAGAIRERADVAVIAEVKRRSPSKGVIDGSIGAADRARAYARGGATALSILTEPTEFGGCSDDLVEARRAVSLPVLRKDFHVDAIQLLESRALGASAVLLIARALSSDRLAGLADEARSLGLEALVEVRSEAELEDALAIRDAIIGVNSRDLETLRIDRALADRLIRQIPAGRIAIAESGLTSREDVVAAAEVGADAVLIGSSLSVAPDPVAAVASMTGVAKVPRGR